jgi:hypothetical protein
MGVVESEETVQLNFNIPKSLKSALMQIAEQKGKTYTETYLEAFREYVDRYFSLVCQGCNSVNPPNSNFCNNCGLPMSPEGLEEFQKIRESILKNPRILLDNYHRIRSDKE